jgi:predicted lipopolysaccharide heptosyltransferase III
MRQWRILHSESSLGWGGQEIRVLAELEWMRANGHWVALAADPRSAILRHAQEAGISLYPIRRDKAFLPWEIPKLTTWLMRNRVDVVNTHSSNDGWLVGLAARFARRPILIRSRHIEVDYPNRFLSGLTFRSLPHHIMTTSQRIGDRLVKELHVPTTDVTCVSTGVDLARFHPSAPGTLRQELGLSPETALVGMISVLRSWKGHATFLEAADHVLKTLDRPVHFVIAGDGPGWEELSRKVARVPLREHVSLLGHRTNVPNVLAGLDVLVLPSYAHEGIPQIILQAQAMSRAVISTTIGGIPEVIEDGVNGLLIAPRDASLLAERICSLLLNPAHRQRLGEAARTGVEKHHSLDAMGARLLKLYEDLEIRHKRAPTQIMELQKIRNIAVFKMRNIGDVLMITPALRALRETFPQARITAVVNSGTEPMLAHNPHIDEILIYDRIEGKNPTSILRRLAYELHFLRELRRRRFDLTIGFTDGDRAAWSSFLCGAPFRLGSAHYSRGKYDPRRLIYNLPAPSISPLMHEVEKQFYIMEAAGLILRSMKPGELCLVIPEDLRAWARKQFEPLRPAPIVHVHPVAHWLWKCWGNEAMAEVIDWLQTERGARVVVTTGPVPVERQRAQEIVRLCRTNPLFYDGNLTLSQTAALAAESNGYFGVDTAPMHMAAAVGVPVVALFGPTNKVSWGPWTKRGYVLSTPCACISSDSRACDWSKTRGCIAAISPAQAKAALDRMLFASPVGVTAES